MQCDMFLSYIQSKTDNPMLGPGLYVSSAIDCSDSKYDNVSLQAGGGDDVMINNCNAQSFGCHWGLGASQRAVFRALLLICELQGSERTTPVTGSGLLVWLYMVGGGVSDLLSTLLERAVSSRYKHRHRRGVAAVGRGGDAVSLSHNAARRH